MLENLNHEGTQRGKAATKIRTELWRREIPSTKLQHPEKLQPPILKSPRPLLNRRETPQNAEKRRMVRSENLPKLRDFSDSTTKRKGFTGTKVQGPKLGTGPYHSGLGTLPRFYHFFTDLREGPGEKMTKRDQT